MAGTPPPNPLKKPGIAVMIGIGKAKPGAEGSPSEENSEPKSEAASEIKSGKGTPADKRKVAGKKPAFKPGPQDKQSAIGRRLAALNGGPKSTNNDAGNASGGFPGM